jgi:uncharacterized protein YdaU (DUF1376 family)
VSPRPWMPLYVGDYLADTRRLTTLQHGIYLLLIMDYWSTGGLPSDEAQLAQIAGVSQKQWECNRNAIAPLFQSGWRHKRIDEELAKAAEVSGKRKASAEKRWSKSNANASANEPPNADAKGMHRAPVSHSQSQSSSLRSDEGETAPVDWDKLAEEARTRPREKAASNRGTRLPSDWQPKPGDWIAAVNALGEVTARREADSFRDYWKAAPGQRGIKLDWDATWRNWVRTAVGRLPQSRAGPSAGSPRNGFHALLDEIADAQFASPDQRQPQITAGADGPRSRQPREGDLFEAGAGQTDGRAGDR